MFEGNLELATVLARLEGWGSSSGWVGPDPYEGLNSRLGTLARSRRSRQLVTQAYKRLPMAPPWPLHAAPRPNAKALALALSGYATNAGQKLQGADECLTQIPRQLKRLNLLPHGAGWGYHFDVQTRRISYASTTPNAIATAFVVGALIDLHRATGDKSSGELALTARTFLLSLRRESAQHGPFFGYVPGDSPLIHNANLLVCGALARLHELEPDEKSKLAVEAATETTLELTRPDGLWPYGELPAYAWVDNFHTAYTLEGLVWIDKAFGLGGDALSLGAKAWRRCFIEPDGWARYYPERRFPLETHCCASAIDLLCALGADGARPELSEVAVEVANTAIRKLWLRKKNRFAFRCTRRGLNRREFMRWTNAPMFRALARLHDVADGAQRESSDGNRVAAMVTRDRREPDLRGD